MAKKIKVSLRRGLAGKPEKVRAVAASLGLHKREDEVIRYDSPTIRGMIRKIEHLVSVEELQGEVD